MRDTELRERAREREAWDVHVPVCFKKSGYENLSRLRQYIHRQKAQ